MLRIAHCADLHLRRDRLDEGLASIKSLEAHCRENGVELIVISGDLWDAPIQNTSAFATVVEAIRSLAYFAPIVMVYGTPSHDVEGSLDVFETLDASHNITILRPGVPYYLGSLHVNPVGKVPGEKMRALLLGVPEPSKKWLLAGQEVVGKEAAEAAVRSSMQALFLGLGGLRKQYPDLPCILLYHGQVSGARTGTGYTASSGIAVSRDDLAVVGADYIALGDIHEPQQIPGLPAYYPGSAYPINWGETHKAGFNYVTIDGWTPTHNDDLFGDHSDQVVVERVDFPHPQKMKLSFKGGEVIEDDLSGRLAWVEITCTKEEASQIDVDARLAEIERMGALPGSRVTLNILPTETVRAGEIAGKKRLRDKVSLWAENSGRAAPESVLVKADEIEGAAAGGVAGKGGAIRLTRLVLRGAIGIWKNSKRDEVELDFEKYGEGVVALVGENGCLSGDTLIDVPRDLIKHPHGIPIRDLVGQEPLVYAYDPGQKKIVLTRGINIRKTGTGRKVVRVTFTSASKRGRFLPPLQLTGTPEHPVMLRDGTYKPLGMLLPGDSLMPLYRRCRDGKYVWINLNNGEFALEHRIVAGAARGAEMTREEAAHHRDRNSFNNSENNIEALAASAHGFLHGKLKPPHYDEHPRGMLGKKHRPEVISQIAETMRGRWSDPEERRRRTESSRRAGMKHRIPRPEAILLRQMYVEEGLPTTAMAKKLGTSDFKVAAWLRECDIPLRHPGGRSPAARRLNHKVLSVEPAGYEDVYDIEVPELHNFVANGVVVHNSGKTTLIENCHPWPCMLTRDGTLKDHFRLRDSARELHFTDEATGEEYKALIQINAATASGGAEYYLYKNGAPLPGINGRKEPYEQAVNELFGSLSLYLKSAFTSQRPSKYSPDFSDATKGQRKDLMAELSGLDYLDAYAAIAKARAEAIEAEVQAKRAEIAVMEGLLAERPEIEAEREDLKKRHKAQKDEVARLVKDGLAAREASNAAEKAAEAQRALESSAAELAKKIVTLDQEKAAIERAAAEMQGLIEHRAEYEAKIAQYGALKEKEEALHAEQTRILRERERIALEHRNSTQTIRDAEQALKAEQARIDGLRAEVREELAVLRQKSEALRERLQDPLESTCPTCGQELPAEKLAELRAKRDEDVAKRTQIEEKKTGEQVRLLQLQSESESIGHKIKALIWPPEPVLPSWDAAESATVARELESINVDRIRGLLKKADEAGVRLQEGAKRLENVEDQRTRAAEAYLAAKGKIDPEIPKAALAAKQALEDLQGRYTAAAGTLASLTTSIEHAERALAEIAAKAESVEASKRQIARQEFEAAEWRTLQEACGQNGIQALELDALCPGIAVVANELLKAACGPRYQIEFSTTRIGGKGSKTKQIEDFLIYIIDAETGMQQEISTLSGGESVWIKRAIYDAFAIIRGRNTGIRFLTSFQDEADGALDPAAREMYFRMLEAAHAAAGRNQTIIITHSREVQDMIGRKVSVSDLTARIAEESVA